MKPQIIALTVILVSFPMWIHLAMDMYKQKHGIKIKHWQSALVAVIVSFLVGLCSFDEKLQFTAFALITHFAFFNPLWNLFHHEALNYAGDPNNSDRAITDRMWDVMAAQPWAQPIMRLIIFSVGYGIYYNWELIVNN